jgi:hypothetical protein
MIELTNKLDKWGSFWQNEPNFCYDFNGGLVRTGGRETRQFLDRLRIYCATTLGRIVIILNLQTCKTFCNKTRAINF